MLFDDDEDEKPRTLKRVKRRTLMDDSDDEGDGIMVSTMSLGCRLALSWVWMLEPCAHPWTRPRLSTTSSSETTTLMWSTLLLPLFISKSRFSRHRRRWTNPAAF